MTNSEPQNPSTPADSSPGQQPGPSASGEYERLAHALSLRFAPHVEAATALVRAAEHELADAREQLQRARAEAAEERYRSDPLVFMRASLTDEVGALDRKTNPKKVRVAFRHLADRALELAEGEVRGYEADQAAAQRERTGGVDACLQIERDALVRLEAAREMRGRVREAERRADEGLVLMMQKLVAEGDDS